MRPTPEEEETALIAFACMFAAAVMLSVLTIMHVLK